MPRRLRERLRERLEGDLDDVVQVLPFDEAEVEVRLRAPREALEDIWWSLLNSTEFAFNH